MLMMLPPPRATRCGHAHTGSRDEDDLPAQARHETAAARRCGATSALNRAWLASSLS
jgi:hypothetical protein